MIDGFVDGGGVVLMGETYWPVLAYVGPGLTSSLLSLVLAVVGVIALIAAVVFVRPLLFLLGRIRRSRSSPRDTSGTNRPDETD